MNCIPGHRGTLHHMEGFNTEQMRQLREIVVEVVQPIQATLDGHTKILKGYSQTLDDNTSATEALGVSISNLDVHMCKLHPEVRQMG